MMGNKPACRRTCSYSPRRARAPRRHAGLSGASATSFDSLPSRGSLRRPLPRSLLLSAPEPPPPRARFLFLYEQGAAEDEGGGGKGGRGGKQARLRPEAQAQAQLRGDVLSLLIALCEAESARGREAAARLHCTLGFLGVVELSHAPGMRFHE